MTRGKAIYLLVYNDTHTAASPTLLFSPLWKQQDNSCSPTTSHGLLSSWTLLWSSEFLFTDLSFTIFPLKAYKLLKKKKAYNLASVPSTILQSSFLIINHRHFLWELVQHSPSRTTMSKPSMLSVWFPPTIQPQPAILSKATRLANKQLEMYTDHNK